MIEAQGTVVALDGIYALIRRDETGCGRCHEEGGCGGNSLGEIFCSTPQTYRVLNPGNSCVGNRVTVVVAEGAVRQSVVLVYLIPLLALFVGAFGGLALVGEVGAIAGSLAGLVCAWLILRYLRVKHPHPYIKN